jgi:hypothetical protein
MFTLPPGYLLKPIDSGSMSLGIVNNTSLTGKCATCNQLGLRSRVTPGGSTSTCAYYSPGWYDEDGKWVNNPCHNAVTTSYSCSNGHGWTETC